jgi:hypothetical protein
MIMLAAVFALALQEKDDVAAAVKKVVELKNYSFRGVAKTEGPIPGMGTSKYSGAYDSAAGLYMSSDTQEWVKIGEKMVTRPKQDWRPVENRDAGSAVGGMGRNLMTMFGAPPRVPHEELKDFASIVSSAKKLDRSEKIGDADCAMYDCDLTEEAARQRVPMGRMMRNLENAEIGGTLRVWVDGNGVAQRYEVVVHIAVTLGGRDVDITTTSTVSLFDIGTAKPAIPDEAKKALESKPKEDE